MAQKISKGTKFRFKNDFNNIHEVLKVEEENNSALVKTTNEKEETEGETKWRLDDINHFVEKGEYVIENYRPDVNKHDQLENCGSHSD